MRLREPTKLGLALPKKFVADDPTPINANPEATTSELSNLVEVRRGICQVALDLCPFGRGGSFTRVAINAKIDCPPAWLPVLVS
jgi:hypothetical protein